MSHCSQGSLGGGVEWKLSKGVVVLLLDQEVNWDFGILEESQQRLFSLVTDCFVSGVSHFDSGVTVVKDTFLDFLNGSIGEFTVVDSVLSRVLDWVLLFTMEFSNLHVSSGDGSGLSAADLVNLSHLFWGIELSNQDLLLVHLHN